MSELGPSPLAAREANLSVAEARAAIAARLQPIDARETVPIAQALGRVLKPADLGLVASLGIETVRVMRRLRVAVFSTGDEITALGQPLAAGCVYDSNRFSLMGALQRLGMEVIDLGLVRDDPVALQAVVHKGIEQADAVLTSGGVSAGDADYTRDVLKRVGEVAFWKVAMRPGRPFAFGPLYAGDAQRPTKTAWLFALPGNRWRRWSRSTCSRAMRCSRSPARQRSHCRCCRHAPRWQSASGRVAPSFSARA